MLSSLAQSWWECYMHLLFFYSSFSLISIKIYHHLHVQSLIFYFSISTLPYSFLLPSSLFLYSLLIHESWATTDFLSTISQIPPSLIYIISFTGSPPPFFSLSPHWSMISYVERRRPPRLATDHWPTLRQRGTPVWRTWWPEVKTSISDGDKGSCPDLIVALER